MARKTKKKKEEMLVYALQPRTVNLEIKRSQWDEQHIFFYLDGKELFGLYAEHLQNIADWAKK